MRGRVNCQHGDLDNLVLIKLQEIRNTPAGIMDAMIWEVDRDLLLPWEN